MKERIIIALAGIAVLACIIAVFSNVHSGKVKRELDVERYNRMTAEEDLQKANIKIKNAQAELEKSNQKLQSIQKILNENGTTADNLKTQLEEEKKQKEALEHQLKAMENTRVSAEGTQSQAQPQSQPQQ